MIKVLILICAVGVSNEDCTTKTALDIVRGPTARSLAQCVKESQSTLAQTSLVPEAGKQYLKVVCEGDRPS